MTLRLVPTDHGARPRLVEELPDRHGWFLAITEVLEGEGPAIAVQPIIDLAKGLVVGYEALARFAGLPVGPDVWFATAAQLGLGRALEARALAAALTLRSTLPRNCFLSMNISPGALESDDVALVLARAGDLDGVVVELTEHDVVTDFGSLCNVLGGLRAKGAKIAVDDAGSGYAGLQWLAAIRPDLVKLDRELVADLDRDTTKVAMVEMLGALSGHMDAWLLAEGVERPEELEAILRLGVPLGQGYLFGKPSIDVWPTLPAGLAAHIGRQDRARHGSTVEGLLERAPTATSDGATATMLVATGCEVVVVVDHRDRPTGVCASSLSGPAAVMAVKAEETVNQVAKRCLTRPLVARWHPVVCVDGLGRYVGIVRTEQLMSHLIATNERDQP